MPGAMTERLAPAAGAKERRIAEARPDTAYPSQLTRYLTRRFLGRMTGRRLLEVGSGRGEFLRGFAREGFEAVGLERAMSRERIFPETVVHSDFEKSGLPFADSSFSVIFNNSVLGRIRDLTFLLEEFRRVLEPGGRVIALVPDRHARWRHFHDDWPRVRPFTLDGISACMASHGFVVAHAERFMQLPAVWRNPHLKPVTLAAAALPETAKRWKFVRFSKERPLLVVADKPRRRTTDPTKKLIRLLPD